MIIKIIYAILVFITILLPVGEIALGADCVQKTVIYYGNGMNNDRASAGKSFAELEEIVSKDKRLNKIAGNLEFRLAYASTGFFITQALEVAMQVSAFWLKDIFRKISNYQDARAAVFSDTDSRKQLEGDGYPTNPNGYIGELQAGKRVIIVSHSQGNLYAQAAYDALVKKDSTWANKISIVHVAAPLSTGIDALISNTITVPEDAIIATRTPGQATVDSYSIPFSLNGL